LKKFIKFFAVLAIVCALLLGFQYMLMYLYPLKYSEYVEKYADEYGLEQSMVYAIIKCESGFKKDAQSGAGAIGLMQITSDTYKWAAEKANEEFFGENALYDINTNIKYGCFIFSMLKQEFNHESTALAAYNAGRSKVKSWLKDNKYSNDGTLLQNIPYPETKKYVSKVLKAQKIYNLLYKRRIANVG